MWRCSLLGIVFVAAIVAVTANPQEYDGRSMLQDFRNRFMTYEHIEIDECPLKYLRPVYSDFCHVALIEKNESTCLGVLVNDYYILSTADCVPEDWKPIKVRLNSGFDLPIADRITYDKYKALNVSKESAPILLRINGTTKLPYDNTAACLWPIDNLISYSKVQEVAYDSTLQKVIQNTTVCSAATQTECLSKTFALWCERKPAGSLLQIRDLDKYSMHPMVVGMFCDEQHQFVPVSRYADWIRDTIARDTILFAIPDAGLGERCVTQSDKEGVCLRIESCPQVLKKLKSKSRDTSTLEQCGFDGGEMLNCCTTDHMLKREDTQNKLAAIVHEIEHCHELYDQYRRTTKEQQLHSQLALIRSEDDKVECVGTLVSKQFVLTAAQCVLQIKSKKSTVKVGLAGSDDVVVQTRNVISTVVHPSFNHQSSHYNVAILALDVPVLITEYSVPACMWPEKDRMPAKLISTGYDSTAHTVTVNTVNPLYYIDCRRKYYTELTLTEACVLPEAAEFHCEEKPTACAESGTGLYGTIYMSVDWRPVNYVVGIYSTGARCAQNQPAIYTRVSEYYPWIKAQLYLLAQDMPSYNIEMSQINRYYPVRENNIRVHTVANKVHYHPEFDATTLANDIALLELVKPIYDFNQTVLPACIWSRDKLPVNEFQTNGYEPFNETDDETARTKHFYITADVYDECVEKVPQNQFCAGYPTALAPNTCHNGIGSAMSRSLYTFNRYFEYIFAINSKGENCGFNMPTVYTRIAPYVQWIDSVIFAPKEFNHEPTEFNLMLLMLKTPLTIDNETIPACLWHNQTHTPLRLEEVFVNGVPMHQYCYPMFNEECERKYPDSNVTSTQLCVEQDKMYYRRNVLIDSDAGSALVSHFAQGVEEYQITYLVGLHGSGREAGTIEDDDDSAAGSKRCYGVYQRISEYYNWIKNVIMVEMQKTEA
uniref:Peptidase S1 domain-containing protein n=1 Tax=Anopheles dirus TaxID=7168 RepID=A0A182NCK0_9DIPT